MRLAPVGIAVSALVTMIIAPANAVPRSCNSSAITPIERKTVSTLQNMHFLQLKEDKVIKILNLLSQKISSSDNSKDTDSVDYHNDLVEQYNSVIGEMNKLSEQFNQLKNLYNALVSKSSPSTNTIFVTCINSEVSVVDATTISRNADLLNATIETLKN